MTCNTTTFVVASLVEMVAGAVSPVGIVARIVAMLFLVIWSGDELLRGITPWRQCLGAAVLIGSLRCLVV